MHDISCIFCKIIRKEIPATIIKENNSIIVFKDISPQASIHYLFVPKIHVPDFSSLTAEHAALLSDMQQTAAQIAAELPAPHAYKFSTNNGFAAGQRVFHLHFHFMADL